MEESSLRVVAGGDSVESADGRCYGVVPRLTVAVVPSDEVKLWRPDPSYTRTVVQAVGGAGEGLLRLQLRSYPWAAAAAC